MTRKKRRQVRLACNGADTRPATAVRDAKRLVQIEVRNVRAEVARCGEAGERSQVRTIDIDLAATRMNERTDLVDARFEDAVRRRIRHHDGGKIGGVLFGLSSKVADIDVAVRVARDDDDAHACHVRRRRIRAMCGRRNQAYVAGRFTATRMPRADHQQSRVLALRAREGSVASPFPSGDGETPDAPNSAMYG